MRIVILLGFCIALFGCNNGGNMTRSYVISKSNVEGEEDKVAAEEEAITEL